MIDPEGKYLTLSQVADELPRRRRGRKTNVSTLYRWTTAGCRGVKLEYVQIGATRCTTREALSRFFERLTQATADLPNSVALQTTSARRKAEERAARELDSLGI